MCSNQNPKRLCTKEDKFTEVPKSDVGELLLKDFTVGGNILKYYTFPSQKDKENAVSKWLALTAGQELKFSVSRESSQVIVELFPWADDETVERFRNSFSSSLWLVFSHPFACQVLKQVVSIKQSRQAGRSKVCKKEDSEDVPANLAASGEDNFLLEVAEHALVNLDELVWNPYAGGVLRKVLELLPASGASLLVEFAERVADFLSLPDLVYSRVTSQFVEAVLVAVRQVDHHGADMLVSSLLEQCFMLKDAELRSDFLFPELSVATSSACPLAVFRCGPASRLLTVAIDSASAEIQASLYHACFHRWLGELLSVPAAGCCLQALLDNWSCKTEFESVYKDMSKHMAGFLAHNPGVLVSLARACLRLNSMQNWFILHLMVAVKCDYPVCRQPKLASQVLQLAAFNEESGGEFAVHLHGVNLLEMMLRFSHPNKVVASLLAMTGTNLRLLMTHEKAPVLVEAFMSCPHVTSAAVDKFIANISESLVSVASCLHGSCALTVMWGHATVTQRTSMVKTLSSKDNLLNKCGRRLADTFGVALYTYSPEEWHELYATKEAISKPLLSSDTPL